MKSFAVKPIRVALATILGLLTVSNAAFADCAGASVSDVKRAYARAQSLEKQGDREAALGAYVRAQDYTCEANPVELDAAKRAASLGLALGTEAERSGDHHRAFRHFEDGAHYSRADAALVAYLRATPDVPSAFEQARSHFENHASPAFQKNNAVRLSVTGPYQPKPALVAEMLAMPAKGIERALQQETKAFDEQYLRDAVQLAQSQPDPSTDFAKMQGAIAAQQAFAQKWPEDPLERSQRTLRTLQQWGVVTRDPELRSKAENMYAQRIEQHIDALVKRYNDSPKLLETAIDYVHMLNLDAMLSDTRVAKIRSLANKLGDDANGKQRFSLAVDYYNVADEQDKEQAARDRMNNAAMAQMQPSMEQLQRQAELMRAQFSDPAQIQAMQAQAEALRKSLEQQQTDAKARNDKGATELEKELDF